MDEDEWTDRNFGNSINNDNKKSNGKNAKKIHEASSTKDVEDTSEDSISDLDTDTDDDDEEDEIGSRPLTADEARQLRREWIKKYRGKINAGEENFGR